MIQGVNRVVEQLRERAESNQVKSMSPKLNGGDVRRIAYKRLGPAGYEQCNWEGMNSPERVAEAISGQTRRGVTSPRFPVYVYGPAGTGKSGIAAVLYRIATSAIWRRADSLLLDLSMGRNDGKYVQEMAKIESTHVLVMDDLGLRKPSEGMFHMLFDILERRKAKMTVITSNHSPEQLRDLIRSTTSSMSKVIQNANITSE